MTALTKGINKIIVMPEEKQKELHDIITAVFQDELKVSNCFILPLVYEKAGQYMRERGYEKANKQTFLAAPLYFNVGYNQKDADAISLKDYPADINFTEKRSYTTQMKKAQFTKEKQRQLAEIVSDVFKELKNKDFIFLANVGHYAGKKLADAGFGPATADLFRKAEDYFTLVWNEEKKAYLLALKNVSEKTTGSSNDFSDGINGEHALTSNADELAVLFSEKKYKEILCTAKFFKTPPNIWGKDNILLLVRTVATYFNENADISLNEFQCKLIETVHAAELKSFMNDEAFLNQGLETTTIAANVTVFKNSFKNVCYGKNNLNNSWRSLTERFWCVKNELAFYFNILWLLNLKNEEPIKFFISQSIEEKRIDRIVNLIDIWMNFCINTNPALTVALKRKILGNCLYCNDIDTLCKCAVLFDDITMPEVKQLPTYLIKGEKISSKLLISYFHSDVGPVLAEHLTNYFWYKQWSNEELSESMIDVLTAVLNDYMPSYIDSILMDEYFDDFKFDRKGAILVKSFPYLCQYVRVCNDSYLLLNYIYVNILDLDTVAQYLIMSRELYDEMWKDATEWLISRVKRQFTNDLNTTRSINYFKFNHIVKNNLEKFYCETFIKPQFDKCTNNENQNELRTQYEASGIEFIVQWINNNYSSSVANSKKLVIEQLFEEKRYAEAIRWIKSQGSHDLNQNQAFALLKKAICENFNFYGLFKDKELNKDAISIYNEITPEVAEAVLLCDKQFSDDVIRGLIATYIYQENWLKVAYLYIPYSATKKRIHPAFYTCVKEVLKTQGIILENNRGVLQKNHFDIVRIALQVLSIQDFDAFIRWAQNVPVPYNSNAYKLNTKPSDLYLKNMLTKGEVYDTCWLQLIKWVLRTDNSEQQDSLRYTIILSYIGRYGYKRFEEVLNNIAVSMENSSKNYYAYYASVWKGVLTGKYSCNLLSLNLALIEEAPLTYWNLFYDVAVCKNHVFTLTSLWGKKWLQIACDVQAFYDELIERYTESRETIFLQIATKLLEQYDGTVNTHFEKYYTYSNSNKPKDFLFQTIIALIKKQSYLGEIAQFLKSNALFLTESESNLSAALQIFCENDIIAFNKVTGLNVQEYGFEKYRDDFLKIFVNYPEFDIVNVIQEIQVRGETKLYQYALMNSAFRISYDNGQFKELQNRKYLIIPFTKGEEYEEVLYSYLELMSFCYRKQLQGAAGTSSFFNKRIRIQNRYHRLLACSFLLTKNYTSYNVDGDILDLMQEYKHFTIVINNYNNFKIPLIDFLKNDKLTERLKKLLLLSVVSNEWDEFVDNIEKYDIAALNCICNMMKHTNYRDLNIQMLFDVLVLHQGNVNAQLLENIKACSPAIGAVIKKFIMIKQDDPCQYEEAFSILKNICRLGDSDNHKKTYKSLTNLLFNKGQNEKKELQIKLLNKHWDIYMTALWATSYQSTIIAQFGQEARKINCEKQKIISWRRVLENISKLSVYHYLLSLWNAARGCIKESKEEYEQITKTEDIPEQWKKERESLEEYIHGKNQKFEIDDDVNISDELVAEEAAKDVDFIEVAVKGLSTDSTTALAAYENILKSTGKSNPAEVLNSLKQLFSYSSKPEELNVLYGKLINKWKAEDRNKDNAKRTYNELVITFGSLLIIEDKILFRHEQKYNILTKIVDVFDLLNDKNKKKPHIQELLKEAERCVFERPCLNLNAWLNNYEGIKKLIQHSVFGTPISIVDAFIRLVDSCQQCLAGCDTQMKRLSCLSKWRKSKNISSSSSDYEYTFIVAVDEEIEILKHGANLKLEVLNEIVVDYGLIEDSRIFYQVENINGDDNVTISFNNTNEETSAQLKVLIGINGQMATDYENEGFSNIVELRPGDVCGQEYKLHSSVLSKIKCGDVIEVILNIVVNGKIICNNNQKLFKYEGDNGILVPGFITAKKNYEYAVPAFSEHINGFGRKKEIEAIRERLKSNLLIIYGASRIGKSSLLNYIKNIYLDKGEYFNETDDNGKFVNQGKAVLSILIAGTENPEDYEVNMLDGSTSIIDWDNKQMWEYLFIAPLLKVFNSAEQDSRCEYFGSVFPEAVSAKIKSILAETLDTYGKYKAISKVLEANQCEIWLLYDEFQQTIKRLSGMATKLGTFCSNMIYSIKGFKLVLCGSDDLVRLFECESDEKWDEFIRKTGSNTKRIGPLNYDDFVEMIMDHDIWGMDTNPFDNSALELLHKYTGGNAICGKIFGNVILSKLHNGYYEKRKKIYSSDITQIAYNLLNSEDGLIKKLLMAHTTKSLDNEKKYLWFIANELIKNPNQSMVPYSKIKDFFVTRAEEIRLALKILVARDILKYDTENNSYGFTTMFYYDYYRSDVTDDLIEKLEKEEHHKQDKITAETDRKRIRKDFANLDSESKFDVAWNLYGNLDSEGVKKFIERINKSVNKTIIHQGKGGTVVTGDNEGEITSDNRSISIQTLQINQLSNTLDGLNKLIDEKSVSGEQYKTQLENLPRLSLLPVSTYIEENGEIEIEEYDELAKYDTDSYVNTFEAGTKEHLLEHENKTIEEWIKDNKESVLRLGIDDLKLQEILSMREEYKNRILTSLYLRYIFDRVDKFANMNNLDYAPVTIMLCKTLEGLLKEVHLPIYQDATVWKYPVRIYDEQKKKQKGIIKFINSTIGTFTTALAAMFEIDEDDIEKGWKNEIRQNFLDKTKADEYQWGDYLIDLKKALKIRNKTAHVEPIVKEACTDFIRLFFKNELLMNTITYVKGTEKA